MRLDPFLQLRYLAVDLVHRKVESGALIATGLVGADILQPVAEEMQRDLDHVQRLPPLLQVAVELDLGRRDQVEVIGESHHLLLNVSANLGRETVRSIVNRHFHFSRMVDRSCMLRKCRPALRLGDWRLMRLPGVWGTSDSEGACA